MSGKRVGDADGGVVGNVYDKYATRNPLARRLMQGFLGAVLELYREVRPASVLEVGCGEGLLADHLMRHGPRPASFAATDVSLEALAEGLDPHIRFSEASVYALPWRDRSVDLVIACEVLEHMERPAAALAELARVARSAVLVSTPREPLWRFLNVLRGRYLASAGNTPGHIQHFGRRALLELVAAELDVERVRTPLPWTVVLARPRA